MVDQLNAFAAEVTRVAREVGTEGKLGGQAEVPGVAGTWKDLTDSVNSMAGNLTAQVRNIAEVATAIATGDLSRKITVDVRGAGTDSGLWRVVIGKGLHKELELMVEAGISPMEAIMAGTRNAANNLGKASELGTIEPGKLADIIAVSGDPLKNIRDTRDIKLVIKDGEILVNRINT